MAAYHRQRPLETVRSNIPSAGQSAQLINNGWNLLHLQFNKINQQLTMPGMQVLVQVVSRGERAVLCAEVDLAFFRHLQHLPTSEPNL